MRTQVFSGGRGDPGPVQFRHRRAAWLFLGISLLPQAALAEAAIGQIKTETGVVAIERAGKSRPATIGDHVFPSDTVVTAARSTVGITLSDNSLMALGPFSRLKLDQFVFDTTTHAGSIDVSLRHGTLAVKSGQIVRQTPEAMKVRTPTAVLAVRGTHFVVRADGDAR